MVSSLHLKNLTHRKLLFRLIIPLITAVIDSFFTSFPAITFAWVLVGIVIGFPFGRLTKISWNSDKTQIVLDGSGMALRVAYMVTSIIRSIILRMEFGYLSYVLAITLLASVGGAIGRTLGMMKHIQLAIRSS